MTHDKAILKCDHYAAKYRAIGKDDMADMWRDMREVIKQTDAAAWNAREAERRAAVRVNRQWLIDVAAVFIVVGIPLLCAVAVATGVWLILNP